MDKCPKCGNKLSSVDVLCPRCGTLVEVVQIKKGSGAQSVLGSLESPAKKAPQQNLVVYNDDLPPDEIFDTGEQEPEAEAIPEPTASVPVTAAPPLYAVPQLSGPPADEPEDVSEADYLAFLKNMNLPALDEINGHENERNDLSGVIREQDRPAEPQNTQKEQKAEIVPSAGASHRWLEIEELAEVEHEKPKAEELQASPPPPLPAPAVLPPPEQRRYRAGSDKGHDRGRKPVTRLSAGRVILMIFVWLVVTCAVFVGFYFFDRYVISHYGSYQTMIYDISNGQIDLGVSAGTLPELPESQ